MDTISAAELRAALERLGWSQARFGRLLGCAPITINRWCRGRQAIPQWAAVAIRYALITEPHVWRNGDLGVVTLDYSKATDCRPQARKIDAADLRAAALQSREWPARACADDQAALNGAAERALRAFDQ